MANRFLETNYYKSPFVRGLKGALKSLYSFIICDCTPAGIWPLDLEAAGMYTGFVVTKDEFEEAFVTTGKAIPMGRGKYFFPDFIEHQYPSGLQDDNKAHKNIIIELKKYRFLREENVTKIVKSEPKICLIYWVIKEDASKGLGSPPMGVQGNGQGNGNGQGQGLGNEAIQKEKFLVPEMLTVYKKINPSYFDDIEKDFKPLQNISIFIHKQSKLNGNHVDNFSIIIKKWEELCSIIVSDNFYKTKPLSTISNQIQEIYQIQIHGKPTKPTISSTIPNKFEAGTNKLLAKGKQVFADITGKQGD